MLEVILCFYVLVSLCWLLFENIPRIVAFILLLPVAPFVCAWEIRKERPFVAWTIIVLWMLFFAIMLLMFVIWKNP